MENAIHGGVVLLLPLLNEWRGGGTEVLMVMGMISRRLLFFRSEDWACSRLYWPNGFE